MDVTIRFSTQDTFFSKLIRLFTWSNWSHVELVLDGRTFGARAEGGVQWRDAEELPYHKYIDFVMKVPDEFMGILTSQEGKEYDFVALAGGVIRRDWQDPNKWFCSELIAWALEQAGVICVQKLNRVSPRELCLILHNLTNRRIAHEGC